MLNVKPSGTKFAAARRFHGRGEEPLLREVLSDPIVHSVMARDGVRSEDLYALVTTMRARLSASRGSWQS